MMQVIDSSSLSLSFEGQLLHLSPVFVCTGTINSVLLRSEHLGRRAGLGAGS